MPEDSARGFLRFRADDFEFFIANERALSAPGLNKDFDRDFNGKPAWMDPGNALAAVGAAAESKALRADLGNEDPSRVEPADLLIEDYSLFGF